MLEISDTILVEDNALDGQAASRGIGRGGKTVSRIASEIDVSRRGMRFLQKRLMLGMGTKLAGEYCTCL